MSCLRWLCLAVLTALASGCGDETSTGADAPAEARVDATSTGEDVPTDRKDLLDRALRSLLESEERVPDDPGTQRLVARARQRLGRQGIAEHPTAALSLHISREPGCDAIDFGSFDCGDVAVTGDNSTTQYVHVFVSGAVGLRGVRFGVAYSSRVSMLGWTRCNDDGSVIPSPTWPLSGSNYAQAWNPCQDAMGEMLLLGYFTIAAGSEGYLEVLDSPIQSSLGGCDFASYRFDRPCRLGRVSVDGHFGPAVGEDLHRIPGEPIKAGWNSCGACQ